MHITVPMDFRFVGIKASISANLCFKRIHTYLFVDISEGILSDCCLLLMQPHGFFNCSPAVDVPPNASDVEIKDNGMAVKPIQNELLAKL